MPNDWTSAAKDRRRMWRVFWTDRVVKEPTVEVSGPLDVRQSTGTCIAKVGIFACLRPWSRECVTTLRHLAVIASSVPRCGDPVWVKSCSRRWTCYKISRGALCEQGHAQATSMWRQHPKRSTGTGALEALPFKAHGKLKFGQPHPCEGQGPLRCKSRSNMNCQLAPPRCQPAVGCETCWDGGERHQGGPWRFAG